MDGHIHPRLVAGGHDATQKIDQMGKEGIMADMATTMPTTNITTIPAASCPRITSSLPPVKYIMSMEPIITNPIARAAQFALVQALSLGFVI